MAKDKIGQIIKRISTQGLIKGRKTSYSAKKNMIIKIIGLL